MDEQHLRARLLMLGWYERASLDHPDDVDLQPLNLFMSERPQGHGAYIQFLYTYNPRVRCMAEFPSGYRMIQQTYDTIGDWTTAYKFDATDVGREALFHRVLTYLKAKEAA